MSKKKITPRSKNYTQEQKAADTEHRYGLSPDEITLLAAFDFFIGDRKTRNLAQTSIDDYERMYKRLIDFWLDMHHDFSILDIEDITDYSTLGYTEEQIAALKAPKAPLTEAEVLTTIEDLPIKEALSVQGSFMPYLEQRGCNIQTVNHYLRSFRAFGNFCAKKGWVDIFECPIKEVEPEIKQVYTNEELEKLTVKPSIDDFIAFRDYCITCLILETGARCNTIINMQVKDVDIDNNLVQYNTTKAHKVISLGIGRRLCNDLAEYIAEYRTDDTYPTDYLFPNQYNEQLTRGGLSKSLAKYNNSKGVKRTGIHLLRHTFAKNWITSGGDIITLARVLTHSELDMVKRYSNLYADDVREEIEEHSALNQLRRKSGKTLRKTK